MKTYIILSLILVFLANAKVQTEAAYGVEPIETLNTSYVNSTSDSANTHKNAIKENQPKYSYQQEKENKSASSDSIVTSNNPIITTTPTQTMTENNQSKSDVDKNVYVSPSPTPTIFKVIDSKETLIPENKGNETCGIGYEIGILDSETSTKPTLECFKI